jgi:hypothetical protein
MFPSKTALRDEEEPVHEIGQRDDIMKQEVSDLLRARGTPKLPQNQGIHDANDRNIDRSARLDFRTREEFSS